MCKAYQVNLRSIIALLFFLGSITAVRAQSGSQGSFSSLKLGLPPVIAASGGVPLALFDKDINLALFNPSLINVDLNTHLAMSFTDYYSDIHAGYAAYSATHKKLGSLTGSIHYLNYGTFTHTDVAGNILGEFKASDYYLQLGWGRRLHPNYTIGSNLKFAYSKLESYSSTALAVDLAASYNSKNNLTAVSLIARNLGRQITSYVDGNRESLPAELMLSMSRKLEKAPLRFHLIATNLEKWDLTYTDPSKPKLLFDPLTGDPLPERKAAEFLDKLTRHVVAGASFLPSDNFQISLGYNYRRRQEMKVESRPALVGFSMGVGVKVNKFRINYARAAYHLSGSPNHISITTVLNQW